MWIWKKRQISKLILRHLAWRHSIIQKEIRMKTWNFMSLGHFYEVLTQKFHPHSQAYACPVPRNIISISLQGSLFFPSPQMHCYPMENLVIFFPSPPPMFSFPPNKLSKVQTQCQWNNTISLSSKEHAQCEIKGLFTST